MQTITADQVRDTMISKEITQVVHHECGGCGAMVFYFREEDKLFFNSNCNCSSMYTPPQRREWSDAAEWINMQSSCEIKQRLAALFGITKMEKS